MQKIVRCQCPYYRGLFDANNTGGADEYSSDEENEEHILVSHAAEAPTNALV